ncbi:MAG: class I tRNA ligase family protein, partial [Lachnospiraceae bacterium]|nr:class I tRNA ligase family protein [Lachnospiraceae bacterium]
ECAGLSGDTVLSVIPRLYTTVGAQIEAGNFRDAITEIFDLVHFANKFFDTEQPWITRTSDPEKCENTLYVCVQIIANLAALLAPVLPFSSEKVANWLGLDLTWKPKSIPAGYQLPETEILFQRIDKKVIAEETAKLKN